MAKKPPRIIEPPSAGVIRVHALLSSAVRSSDPRVDLTFRQIVVLTSLRTEACTPGVKELATYLNLSRPAVTRALDRLETLKLAKRTLNRADKRTVDVALTSKGASMVSSFDAAA
jgi:DNA-binding MarR family transcriptional regulator